MEQVHTFNRTLDLVFLALQTAIVLFLLLHDWIPLGRLNNNAAKRREDSPLHLVTTTLVAAVPAGVGLFYCARYFGRAYPGWLDTLLWITGYAACPVARRHRLHSAAAVCQGFRRISAVASKS
jgi:hypothetical protein